ncbi:MAG: 4-hydroxy-tetrahydrodipicolinate synthase [Hadesarchaea archaeon]|nr:MAG: 4-hydroxy-tetrahydrodipicolinate synthase [Hadesarchaea archaeon]TKJ26560.1 MAG: 4-hydroxy-tetrahydrodipicolinate synthase [Hadesarchaea archaeon B3_Hades]
MFEGAMTAMVTPFDREGKVDEEGLRENVRFQIKKGVHGLVPVGTTGECATLSYEEHNRVVDVVVDAAKGKVPVLAGTGSNSTWEATMLTKHAKEVGADGALLVVPYYNKPTQAGLYQHYKRIAEEVDLPQVIYNIPSRTSLNMLPETMAKLAKVKNIVGVKEASGDLKQIARIIELAGKEFSVISGDDPLTLEIMKLGGVGIISVTSNLVPDKLVKMVDSFRSGDVQTAKRINDELAPLFKALFIETNPGPAKMAMNWMGMAAGGLRLPLVELEPENQEKLRKVLVDMGLVK